MFQILTNNLPILPNIDHLPADANVLVFESNLGGYRRACDWIAKNDKSGEPLYRLAMVHKYEYVDVGDFLCKNANSCKPGDIVQIKLKRNEILEWPYVSEHSVEDFEQSIRHLENDVLLRDAFTGLSVIQELIQEYAPKLSFNKSHILAVVSTITMTSVSKCARQWDRLFNVQNPYLDHNILPRVVINGPVPVSIKFVHAKLLQYIQTGKLGDWSNSGLDAGENYRFQGAYSICRREVSTGDVVAPPYGISADEFHIANPDAFKGRNIFNKDAANLTKHLCEWDPQFRNGQVWKTMDEYLSWWVEEAKARLSVLMDTSFDERENAIYESDYIRSFCVGKTTLMPSGKDVKWFTGETLYQKRQRIEDFFGSRYYLLDIPSGMLGMDNVKESKPVEWTKIEDYWRDMLMGVILQ